jgi:hypothetical protein
MVACLDLLVQCQCGSKWKAWKAFAHCSGKYLSRSMHPGYGIPDSRETEQNPPQECQQAIVFCSQLAMCLAFLSQRALQHILARQRSNCCTDKTQLEYELPRLWVFHVLQLLLINYIPEASDNLQDFSSCRFAVCIVCTAASLSALIPEGRASTTQQRSQLHATNAATRQHELLQVEGVLHHPRYFPLQPEKTPSFTPALLVAYCSVPGEWWALCWAYFRPPGAPGTALQQEPHTGVVTRPPFSQHALQQASAASAWDVRRQPQLLQVGRRCKAKDSQGLCML